VLGIRPSEITPYVHRLTPVVLRMDTLVMDHSFVRGRANAYEAVLQAGTAILVDHFGMPRIKCSGGNPLTAATLSSSTAYMGTRWTDFSARRVVAIAPAASIIQAFSLIDATGQSITQAVAADTGSGSATGSNTTSGNSTGGNTTSGHTSGGSTTGGSTTGGSSTGGSTTGGRTTGGSSTGGSSTSGGSTGGGTTGGGSTGARSTGGGSTGGGAGGGPSGGR